MSSQLVLDIPFKSINNWMQERRILPNDWLKKHKAAQIKCEELKQEFPSNNQDPNMNKIKTYLQQKIASSAQSPLQDDYRVAKQVFKMLIETTEEGKQKNILGRYKSQLVKDWQLVLRIYESENIYLAEYGKAVQQLHGFDLPSMKKQLHMISKQVNESTSKQNDLRRQIKEQDQKFKEECQKLEIMPTLDQDAIERQLYDLTKNVITTFRKIEEMVQSKQNGILEVIEFYKEYNKQQVYRNDFTLLMLTYFSRYGDENLKAYEFRKQHPSKQLPKDIQERENHKYDLYGRMYYIVKGESEQQEEQVFEITLEGGGSLEEDVSSNLEKEKSDEIEIKWTKIESLKIVNENNQQQNSKEGKKEEEPWEMIEDKEGTSKEIVVDIGKNAQFNEEETILYNAETRQLLVNDLEEVEFFMRQRLAELQSKDQAQYAMYAESKERKEIIKQCDQVEFLLKNIEKVTNIVNEINNKELLQLLLMRQKPKVTAQRIIQKLMIPIKLKEKYEQNIISIEKKSKEMMKEIESLKKIIEENELIVKEFVSNIQSELSTKLKVTVRVQL